MHLDGSHTLNAPIQMVWDMMMDPRTLEKVIPGLSTLEQTGEDKYKAVSEVKMGPVNGSFKGKMEVKDKVLLESFVLKMKQNSKIGNVSAEGSIQLKPIGTQQTVVLFSGDAKLSGTLARTGQRVLTGVANSLTKQFFQSLEDEINAIQGIVVERPNLWTRIIRWFQNLFRKRSTEASTTASE